MTPLQRRLKKAAGAEPDYKGIAKACGISVTSVKKWFGEGSQTTNNIQMDHLFRVADYLKINARWLAVEEGPMRGDAPRPTSAEEFPLRRIDLLRMYGRLPKPMRYHIRQLITDIAGQIKVGKWKLSREEIEEIEASARPGAPPTPASLEPV
jgi:hypothetical protein